MEEVAVSLSPDGIPEALDVGGRAWQVVHEPVRWLERVPWWKARRLPERIDVEVWRLQCLDPSAPEGTEPNTLELVHGTDGIWRLRSFA